ncbi:MAG: PQQ-dependent sugar dehydrogenase [Saprospiraceae bacterium]|nr:PQQ-dependent sugar dehydrogenase [Saprospiraceae bacterium]MBK9377600.1 PQQ-dependent sugar dehydrogenase [Saprospiraceae bacterium]
MFNNIFQNIFLLIAVLFAQISHAQNKIILKELVSGLSLPVEIANCGDERLFIVEKAGRIKIIENNKLEDSLFLNIVDRVNSKNGEQGLLGLAFDPNFLQNGYFYVNYTDKSSNEGKTTISRFSVSSSDKNKAIPSSEKIIMSIPQPFTNHNGGCLRFGPDGFLYIGMGDGGSANDPMNNGQSTKTRLGKILRIDVSDTSSYKVPQDNPFINDTNYLPEIWAYGLRNPWRFSFDRLNHDLWIGDVGQGMWEEINLEKANSTGGKNYGWRCYEGNHAFIQTGCNSSTVYTPPIFEYVHSSTTGLSITGGFVYRGKLCPYLTGKYIYGDYDSGRIWGLDSLENGSFSNELLYDFKDKELSTFGEDKHGELFMASIVAGKIYQLLDSCNYVTRYQTKDATCEESLDGKIELYVPTNSTILWQNGQKTPTISMLSPGDYGFELKYNYCIWRDTLTVGVLPKQKACLKDSISKMLCSGDSLNLESCNSNTTILYFWYKNNTLNFATSDSTYNVKDAAYYSVQWLDTLGCYSLVSDSIFVSTYPQPITPILSAERDTICTNAVGNLYYWFLDTKPLDTTTTPCIVGKTKGNYSVFMVDTNGCNSANSKPLFFDPLSIQDPFNEQMIVISPQPAKDIIRIECHHLNCKIESVQVYNFQGQSITIYPLKLNEMTMNVSPLIPGKYVLKIKINGKEYSKLIVKE